MQSHWVRTISRPCAAPRTGGWPACYAAVNFLDSVLMPLNTHDPGTTVARERAEVAESGFTGVPGGSPIAVRGGGRVVVGTAGWTDRTLTARGVFYPDRVTSPETRLRYYASRFAMVEADSPYYALPVPATTALWAERTPAAFLIDVKAYALMTGHPAEVKRLPTGLRQALPRALATQTRVYPKDLPPEIVDEVWATFRGALEPLRDAGKLGLVLLQYPRWFLPNAETKDQIVEAQHRLNGIRCAVEFRNRRWMSEHTADRTLNFLQDHDLPYVTVDEPQGLQSSVPPVAAVTSPTLAVVRLHGRRGDLWEKSGVSTTEKYRYLYDRAELEEWVTRVIELARRTAETHVVFNNCYANYGTTNATEFAELISAAVSRQ